MSDVALSTDQIGGLAIGVIGGLVIAGLILGLIVQKIIAKVVVAVVVIGLGVAVWSQRTTISDRVRACDSNVTFFGFHTTLSTSAQKRCTAYTK